MPNLFIVPKPVNQITLRVQNSVWYATYAGPHAKAIRHTLGTATVPTAFTSATPGPEVMEIIARNHPGKVIILEAAE